MWHPCSVLEPMPVNRVVPRAFVEQKGQQGWGGLELSGQHGVCSVGGDSLSVPTVPCLGQWQFRSFLRTVVFPDARG